MAAPSEQVTCTMQVITTHSNASSCRMQVTATAFGLSGPREPRDIGALIRAKPRRISRWGVVAHPFRLRCGRNCHVAAGITQDPFQQTLWPGADAESPQR